MREIQECCCQNWADSRPAWVCHHTRCPHYDIERDATRLLTRLVRGIEAWASDGDGVHSDLWAAYCDAKLGIGEGFPKEPDHA